MGLNRLSPLTSLPVILLAILSWFPPAQAQYEDAPIEFTRYPFLPTLSVNQEPAVCEQFLENVTAQFKSREWEHDLVGYPYDHYWNTRTGIFGFDTLSWTQRWDDAQAVTANLDIDLDGDGQLELLIGLRSFWRYWNVYDLYVISDREKFIEKAKNNPSGKEFYALLREFGQEQPMGGSSGNPIRLFSAHNGIYFFAPDYLGLTDGPLSLFRLGPDGKAIEACSIRIYPESFINNQREANYNWVLIYPDSLPDGFREFFEIYRTVLGERRGCRVSSASTTDWVVRRGLASGWRDLLYRPWVGSAVGDPPVSGSEFPNLAGWAQGDLWTLNTYRKLREERSGAIDALGTWYEVQFGLERQTALTLARQRLDDAVKRIITGSPLNDQSQSNANLRTWQDALNEVKKGGKTDPKDLQAYFRTALVDGAYARDIESFIAAQVDIHAQYWGTVETPLFLALEHPRNVELLLEHGADPNHGNHFGKTPLMYAAHFNLHETAEVLLRAGADPNARTAQKADTWCNQLRYIDRSALMYAAENADEQMMALLIDAGADTNAADSGKRRIVDYLALNEELTDAKRAAITARWELQ